MPLDSVPEVTAVRGAPASERCGCGHTNLLHEYDEPTPKGAVEWGRCLARECSCAAFVRPTKGAA